MRKKLLYNYWLIIISWCMFLNDLFMVAFIFNLIACLMLITINRRINYWRMAFVSLILYVGLSIVLPRTNVPLFFPNIYPFLALLSINSAFTFERLYLLKSKYIKPFLVFMLTCLSVLSIILVLLPAYNYTIFTKSSLCIMIGLIFLPYLIPIAYCLAYKKIRDHIREVSLQHKEASIC